MTPEARVYLTKKKKQRALMRGRIAFLASIQHETFSCQVYFYQCKNASLCFFIFLIFIITIVGSVSLHFLLFVLCLFSFDFFAYNCWELYIITQFIVQREGFNKKILAQRWLNDCAEELKFAKCMKFECEGKLCGKGRKLHRPNLGEVQFQGCENGVHLQCLQWEDGL